MRKTVHIIFCFFFLLTACTPVINEPEQPTQQTVLFYLPWSQSLSSYFQQNIRDLEHTLLQRGLQDERVLVYAADSATHATMYEIVVKDKVCEHITKQEYTTTNTASVPVFTDLLADVNAFAPAERYGMIIGGHGTAWLPSGTALQLRSPQKNTPLTRWFGGEKAEWENQTDVATLVESLQRADLHLEYILFDNCFMSSIEVLYDLKDVVDYVIASPTEIMATGMPYATMGKHLLGKPNYEAICQAFYDYYAHAKYYPYGTLAITDCHQIDSLATIVHSIANSQLSIVNSQLSIQDYDGFTVPLFYDLQDYIASICTDSVLLKRFEQQLARTIPFSVHTDCFYSALTGAETIHTYSGLNTSAPTTNSCATSWPLTNWAKLLSEP